MNIIDIWDINADFWKLSPELAMIPEFLEIKKKYKGDSSKYMWAVALFADYRSKFRTLSEKDKRFLISKEYLKKENFDWEILANAIKAWQNLLPPAQKQLMIWEKFMQEKNEFMATLNYAEHGDEIEKKLISNGKLFEEYARLRDLVAQEEDPGQVKGNAEESLSEKGLI